MPDFRQQMGPNPYPQMGQMYQQQGQQPFTQMGGQQSYQQPGPQLTQPQPAGVQVPPMPSGQQPSPSIPGMLPLEQSYIENILRLNRGKVATVYMTFENNPEWNAKVFRGEIEAAGRDHIILSDRKTGTRYLLLMVYLDYITFDEPITYDYPYSMASYTPR
ncbi:spore coat protein GerQ [Bacillus licheniformis]|nr:spore coat protein GerQ [Bacillus licheniformis]QNT73702.1 spore coat protein GerQ [Bacillus licheniformis]